MKFPCHIYIDGGDPEETRTADAMLKKAGYHGLDGQTTNPSLIAKNYAARNGGKRVSMEDAFREYKRIVKDMSSVIPAGKISIQVIGDPATMTTEDMISQARDRVTWISNGIIKIPCTQEGLAAVEVFCQEGPVNVTLSFSQDQAAAVYNVTKTHNYEMFVSPFVGRFDDRGENGMDIVANVLEMYRALGDGHVKVICASIRNINHLMYTLWLRCDIATIPFKVFTEWADSGFPVPAKNYIYNAPGLADIPYKELTLDRDWRE